jgi:BatD DUF11 like domain
MSAAHNHIDFCFAKRVYLLAAWCLLFSGTLSAQKVVVKAEVNDNSIRIGEQAVLTLSVTYNAKLVKQIVFPAVADTLVKNIEVLKKSRVMTNDSAQNELTQQTQKFIITGFDSGYYAIPPFKFIVNKDTAHPLETETFLFEVHTVEVDTTQPIKDIKPPLSAPFQLAEIVPYLIIGATIIALLLLAYFLYTTFRKKKNNFEPIASQDPPHVTALNKLDEIAKQKLWQEGKIKEYYSAITDVLRIYIEKTFPVSAMELTTDEIMYRFRKINIPRSTKEKLYQTLATADMVKFAKEIPLADENDLSLANAIQFIKETLPEQEIGTTNA